MTFRTRTDAKLLARVAITATVVLAVGMLFGGCIAIDPLDHAQRVVGRTETGLLLADGRTVALPEVASLEPETPLLDAATRRGVEVTEGRPYGQIKLWHWCGNDPMLYHLVRVDLAHLVVFTGEADPVAPEPFPRRWHGAASMSRFRWNVSSHRAFLVWEEELANRREAKTVALE